MGQRYQLPVATNTFGLDQAQGGQLGQLVPDHGTTRCQFCNIGIRWCHEQVPNAYGGIGTGWWHQPVHIVQEMASGHATTRCP
jgi:hypothetical protein